MGLKIKEGPGRVYAIDEIRGIAILGMLVVHGLFYYDMIFGTRLLIVDLAAFQFIAIAGGGLFIFISGVSCSFSRNNVRRGFIALGFGVAISLVTFVLWKGFGQRDTFIFFGILHLLGVSMILFGLLEGPAKKLRPLPAAALFAGLFTLSWFMVYRELFRDAILGLPAMKALFDWNLLYLAGYPNWRFFPPVDFYPLLPWVLLFLAGAFLGIAMVRGKLPEALCKVHVRFLVFCGQHTLAIYLVHPLVLYPLMLLWHRLAAG